MMKLGRTECVTLRVPRSIFLLLRRTAAKQGVSVNEHVNRCLDEVAPKPEKKTL